MRMIEMNVRAFRKRHDLSQKALARLIEVSERTIRYWEQSGFVSEIGALRLQDADLAAQDGALPGAGSFENRGRPLRQPRFRVV